MYVFSRNIKNIRVFLSENFQFLEVKFSIYSRTSMARKSLGPWKFVRDMGSSSH